MLLEALLGAAVLTAAPMSPPLQEAPSARAQDPAPVQLDEIVVTGRRLDDLISDFVGEVAEPNSNRGLARWDRSVCVGVVNLKSDAAQYIADRVSTVADDLGLDAGEPGCAPNIMVVATADSNAFAKDLVERRRRSFRTGGSGMDRGLSALRDFQDTLRPVRWWQVSAPIDSQTGQIATRQPNEATPIINTTSASRLRTEIVDRLLRVVVIVDANEVSSVNISQLADYIAMISMSQVDPDADTSQYASILNVFDQADAPQYLTDWDRAYLVGLYDAEQNQTNRRAGRSEISRAIRRAHQDLVQGNDNPQR